MSAPIPADVGPVYDLVLATRDGTSLACKNKDGQTVLLSQVAFMCSIDPKNTQHEETELQHKDNLVQLTGNLIDREFDQWPQVTQGDWSGGALQRVLTGGTPLTSFGPQSDPSRYWEGDALLWPTTEVVPQRGAAFPPVQDAGGGSMSGMGTGTPAGGISIIGQCFAYLYATVPAAHVNLILQNNATRFLLQDPPGIASGSGTPTSPAAPTDFFIGAGSLWYTVGSAGGLQIYFVAVSNGVNATAILFDTIANATSNGFGASSIGYVGSRVYLAVPIASTVSPTNRIRLYDITLGTATSFVEINFNDTTVFPGANNQVVIDQTDFMGDQLIIALHVGFNTESLILSYSIASGSGGLSTLARFPAEGGNAFFSAGNASGFGFAVVAGSLFVISGEGSMYLIQGGSVQHIGPLPLQVGTQSIAFFQRSISRPAAYGPYAIFAVSSLSSVAGHTIEVVYAYDVLRGRLFRMSTLDAVNTQSTSLSKLRIGILHQPTRAFAGASYIPQWGVVIPTLLAVPSGGNQNAQEYYMGVSANTGQVAPPLVNGSTIISSAIDFTSAQPKLFRRVVLAWSQPGLPAAGTITVQVDVWLDQDPSSLNPVPDFTTGAVGNGVNGGVTGQTQLKLPINKIARKLVYRIITTGGDVVVAGALASAVQLRSISIQVATGWTRTMTLDLADNVLTNSKQANDYCWPRQQPVGQPPLDATAAYNFTRQLWRLTGGEVTATFPNGDPPADWLLQDIRWDSPKPFGSSFRADQRSGLGYIVQLKMREDI